MVMLFLAHVTVGQNDFFFNHYMFNPSYYNPAWVGVESEAFVAAHHRSQWVGYNASLDPGGPPTTQLLSLVIPVESRLSGLGLSVVNDRVGNVNNLQARFSVSTQFQLGFGSLSVGVMPSLNAQSIDANFRPTDPGDDLIPVGNETQFEPNLHAGVYLSLKKDYFIGASVENLIEPGFDFGTNAENILERNYLLTGGTEIFLSRAISIRPSILVRSDLNVFSYELSTMIFYEEKMWTGVAFRRSESISLFLGYSFLEENKLKAGYSFDYVIDGRDAKQPTSHEIFIRYDLPDLVFGGRKAVKTPRFTF